MPASLLDVANDEQRDKVDILIADEVTRNDLPLLPAFHPVIEPVDADLKNLQVMFSYTFKNKPYEFQNGGLWPMVTGFYVADLARRKQTEAAKKYLQAIHQANALTIEGEAWGFPEFVHGKKSHSRQYPAPGLERCRSDHRPACAGWTAHFQD